MQHSKYFRKFFGRPHKFRKFAKHNAQAAGFSGNRCPFSRQEGYAQPAPGTADIFDFTALMDFINGISGANPESSNDPAANASAAASSEATPGQQAGTQGTRTPRPTGFNYVNGINQAINAFLDAFGESDLHNL